MTTMIEDPQMLFHKATNNLYSFYNLVISKTAKQQVSAPHIKILAKNLMELYLGDFDRLCVSMPPSALQIFNGYSGIPLVVNDTQSDQ